MQPIPYLFFNGNCAEAMTFWASVFGAEDGLDLMKAGTMPPDVLAQMPGVDPDAIMHGALKIGEGWIYASDDMSATEDQAHEMKGVSLTVSMPTVGEAERVFAALSEGGEVRSPLKPEFFAPAFGTLSDRFGVRWMVMADPPGQG